jgi:hypothetical protein
MDFSKACYIFLDLTTLIIFGEAYNLCSSSLHSLFQRPATLTYLGRNIFLSSLLSNTLNLPYSLRVKDEVSQPYKTTGKIKPK